MKLIVALGNPGKEYEKTRHNAGWLFFDKFLEDKEGITCQSKFKAQVCEMHFGSQKVFFVKPQTYMNLSGQPILEMLNFYHTGSQDILVLHDEIDLPLGEIRLSKNSSSAGHNGIQNIIDLLGTKDFSRIRIGIESREDKKTPPTHDYVLRRFTEEELTLLFSAPYATTAEWIEKFISA